MNAREIAEKRKAEIEYSSARIQAKIEAGHPRSDDLEARLAEYNASMELIDFTIKTGRPVRLKGDPTDGDVSVSPPAGSMTLEGK